jgi:TolB-like protein
MKFFQELKRRNVFRVGVAYLVASWLLLQIADVVLSLLDLPVIAGQMIFLLLAFGFIPALIFAWAFELTPDGIKREKDVAESKSNTGQTGRTLDRIILASVALAVLLLIVDRYFLSQPVIDENAVVQSVDAVVEEGPSIAVLPFHNMSGNQENEYFSDGLTETLLHMLAQLPDLRVAARTSSFAFKGQSKDIREIAMALNVAHILEGSVQRAGDQVRVTAQLIRADDGFHVWSQNYDRTLDDIFAIQDEIAADVASALHISLLADQPVVIDGVSTTSVQAYDDYLRALEKMVLASFSALDEAENLLKHALASDPGFFDAKVALAHTYRLQVEIGKVDESIGLEKMGTIVESLLTEHPGKTSTRVLEVILQIFHSSDSGDFSIIEELLPEIRSILEIAPQESAVRLQAASILTYFGKSEEAIQLLEDGIRIDPLNPDLHLMLAHIYARVERLDDAEHILTKAHQIFPDSPGIPEILADTSLRQGEVANAFHWLRKAVELDAVDHELVIQIARLFYQFGFIQAGDHWASRAKALDAGAPAYRDLELKRALAIGEPEKIRDVAKAIITDEVGNRAQAFENAFRQYAKQMQAAGLSRQLLDELTSQFPGVNDFANSEDGYDMVFMKWTLLQIWKELSPADEFKMRYEVLITTLDEKGIPWRNTDWMRSYFALLEDDREVALPATIKMLDGWSVHVRWWKGFEKDYTDSWLMKEPEIASRIAAFRTEEKRWQAEIEQMLQEPEWAL